ncbi:hypothetical protein [Flavobacterium algicola]|uniref:hypothetical protein n=1 Tax=Flavobacterium algicola TaxID=556529 RepID=UPI001EFCD97E|nr:hypothetical protein [Flavobacterium algicola]MCG9792512.1 hypothetical protein [Flavobacterium algicola]
MSNISKNHHFNVVGEIQSAFGFYKFYFANLHFYAKREDCFKYCNLYFREQFGYNRYDSWEEFFGVIGVRPMNRKAVKITTPIVDCLSVEKMERNFLIALFKQKGFDTWTSFKAIVMHYYQADETKLMAIWKGGLIDPETLKYVDYVRQIIG